MPVINVNGNLVRFDDDLTDDQISAEIEKNPTLFDPNYKAPKPSTLDRMIGFAKSIDPVRIPKTIAEQAEESDGENVAAKQIKGAPVRQSYYNKVLLDQTDFSGRNKNNAHIDYADEEKRPVYSKSDEGAIIPGEKPRLRQTTHYRTESGNVAPADKPETPASFYYPEDKGAITPRRKPDDGILSRINAAAKNDLSGQEQQRELEGLRTDENVPEGGFVASAKSMAGQTIRGAGRVASDYFGADKDNALMEYGAELIRNDPVAIRSLNDIKDRPFLAFKEASGNMVPSFGAMIGTAIVGQGIISAAPLTGPAAPVVAAVGAAVKWLGPAAIAALPSYSGIRDKQIFNDPKNEEYAKSKAIAALGAAAVGTIEVAFGPQNWAISMLTKEGRVALARKLAATTPAGAFLKGAFLGGGQEMGEELAQNPIEQLASYDNPLTKENLEDTAFGGAMGFLGGVAPGAVTNTFNFLNQQAQSKADRINAERVKLGLSKIESAKTVDEAIAAAQEVNSQNVTKDDVLSTEDPTLADIERLTGLKPSEAIDEINAPKETIPKSAGSWTIIDKKNGNKLFDTDEKNMVDAIDANRYDAIPTDEYNKRSSAVKSARDTEIVLPDNTSLKSQWDIVDADSVKASLKEGQNQPRDRTRAASDLQIQSIANNPDYRRLSDSPVMDVGSPVISDDGQIVGGNGRFEALSRAYDQQTAQDYLDQLRNDAARKGLDPSVIDSMNKPILVRRITEPFDTRKLAIASNSGTSAPYSARENAKIDAERIGDISNIDITDSGDIALTPRNMQIIRDSMKGYTAAEQSSFVDSNGNLSQEGARRFINAILYNAYGDSDTLTRLIESTDNDMRNVAGALMRVAGDVAKVRQEIKQGAIPKELDITDDLIGAVEKIAQLRSQNIPVQEYLAQQDIFGNGLSDDAKQIVTALHDNIRSQNKIAQFIRDVYDGISRVNIATGDMLGNQIPSKGDVIQNAKPAKAEQGKVFTKPANNVTTESGQESKNNDDTKTSNEKINDDVTQGKVGMMLSSGQVVKTLSGRLTTPFPAIKTGKVNTGKTTRAVEQWLMQNALEEALSRNDKFNARIFKADIELQNSPQASKDSAEEYLFGYQPEVQKPFLKPLNKNSESTANAGNKESGRETGKVKPLLSKSQKQQSTLTKDDIQPLADKYNKKLTYGKIIVLNNESELPGGTIQLNQTAWHGSPHDHDKFSTSKIGTGEGNQAYGHGLYFASSKDVAEFYKDNIKDMQKIKELNDEMSALVKIMNKYETSYRKYSSHEGYDAAKKYDAIMDERNALVAQKGKLYEVELKPSEDEYLLWDKPLSEQSEKVKSALGGQLESLNTKTKRIGSMLYASTNGKIGAEIPGGMSGQGLYSVLKMELGSDKKASEYLHSIGIRGIKYLDGTSRGAGEGSYNYVIFSDNDVEIKAKYSKDAGLIEGAYVGDSKVYIIADAFDNMNRVDQVIQHELSHLASEELLDSKEYKTAIRSVNLLDKSGNKTIRDIAKIVDKRQPGLDADTRAKEILAMSVETGKYKNISALRRVVADVVRAFKAMLRRLGVKLSIVEKMSEQEVFATMRNAMDMLYSERNAKQSGQSESLKSEKEQIPETLNIDGISRPTRNSNGQLIHPTEEGIRNFWKWLGDGYFLDPNGKPYVFYHQTSNNAAASIYEDGFRTDLPRARESDPRVPDGVFLKPNNNNIGVGATEEKDIAQIPLYTNIKNPFIVQSAENMSTSLGDKTYSELVDTYEDTDKKLAEEFDKRWAEKTSNREAFKTFADEYFPRAKETLADIAGRARERLTEVLQEKGYDGVIISNDKGSFGRNTKTIVALDTNQVKSATENNGDFSKKENGILLSKAPQEGESSLDLPEETFARALQRKSQDKFNRFNVIKEFLEKEKGIKLSENADVYRAEERYHSKVTNQIEDFREKVRNPLIKKWADAGYTKEQIEEYLKQRHALEANIQNRKLTGEDTSNAYGITDEQAQEYLDKAPKELAKLADEVQEITDATQKLRLDNGIETQERVDAMRGAYKYYIPVRGDFEAQEAMRGSRGPGGRGFDVRYRPKRRLGHAARNEDVIGNIFQDYERAIVQVEKNRVAKSLALMAAEIQMPDLISIDQPIKRKVLRNEKAYGVLVKGALQDIFQTKEAAEQNKRFIIASQKNVTNSDITIAPITDQRLVYSASPMLDDNEVMAYMNGHEIRIQIKDDLLAQAYKNLGVEALPAILRVGRAMNGWMSKAYTGYNPEFILTNLRRDFTTGIINTTGEEGFLMAMKAVKNYPRSFASLLKYAATGVSNKWIDSYRANGGNTGAAYLSDLERLGEEVNGEYAAYQGVLKNLKAGDRANALRAAGRKAFNASLKYIEHLNQAGENAYRLAVFKAMIESGKSVNEAIHLAKNVTVNFNRKGELGGQFNAAYLFFNANLQGSSALAHALFKGKHKYQAWALAGGGLTALGYVVASALGGFDDPEKYDAIGDAVKSRNMIFAYGDGYVKIPVPYGAGFFYNVGRIFAEAQRKGEIGKLPYQLAAIALEEFSPFNVASSEEAEFNSQKVMYGLLPTVPRIPMEISGNFSTFTGREMYPEKEWYKSEPDNEKMWRGTKGTVYDVTAQLLVKAGIEISPETLKYLTRTATGGAGSFADSVVSAAMLKSQGADLEAREIPFLRKEYGEVTIQDMRQRHSKAKEEAVTAAEKFNAAMRKNDLVTAKQLMGDTGELIALKNYADKLSDTIKYLRDMQDSIKLSEDYTVAEKRLKIKELEKREEKFYNQYLDIFKTKKSEIKRRQEK